MSALGCLVLKVSEQIDVVGEHRDEILLALLKGFAVLLEQRLDPSVAVGFIQLRDEQGVHSLGRAHVVLECIATQRVGQVGWKMRVSAKGF